MNHNCLIYKGAIMERFNIEEMYNKYFKTVYRFLLALTSNPDIAEELTQETFYKAII